MKTLITIIALSITAFVKPVMADYNKAVNISTQNNIVETVVATRSFNTMAAALRSAGLIDVMKSYGPFTIFAPTDEAFSRLPKGTIEMLLRPENKTKLINILTYHIVPTNLMTKQAVSLDNVIALNEKNIELVVRGESLILNGNAKVVKADIECSNGVIHVIDNVIIPPSE